MSKDLIKQPLLPVTSPDSYHRDNTGEDQPATPPPLTVPAGNASVKDRAAFCNAKMEEISEDPSRRPSADELLPLAQQLKYLERDKSRGTKVVQGAFSGLVLGITQLTRPLINAHAQVTAHAMKSNFNTAMKAARNPELDDAQKKEQIAELNAKDEALKKEHKQFTHVLKPSRYDMANTFTTQQRKVFDFVLSALDPTIEERQKQRRSGRESTHLKRAMERMHVKIGTQLPPTLKERFKGQAVGNNGSVSPEEIAQRINHAPVWTEMLQQTGCLKYERQQTLLDSFRRCFNDLPNESKSELVPAFGASFTAMANELLALADENHPDTVSPLQTEAITLLKQQREFMTPAQRNEVLAALRQLPIPLPWSEGTHPHPMAIELNQLEDDFSRKDDPLIDV